MRRRVAYVFAWYDLWVGFYWDRKKRWLYFFPLPMLGIRIDCSHRSKYIGHFVKTHNQVVEIVGYNPVKREVTVKTDPSFTKHLAEPLMALPPGKTCADCWHLLRCTELLNCTQPNSEYCDFFPSRFRERGAQHATAPDS